MTFLLCVGLYLTIGVLLSIHGMRAKWLPANKANVTLCVFTWIVFVSWFSIDYLINCLVRFGKGTRNAKEDK